MRNSLMVKVVSGSGTLEKCSKYVTLKFHLQLEGNFNCLAESLNWISFTLKAKEDYEREQRKKERRKETGESSWMLPSLSKRLAEVDDNEKVLRDVFIIFTKSIIHLVYPPKILYNCCFQFLLGITVVPREIEDDRYRDSNPVNWKKEAFRSGIATPTSAKAQASNGVWGHAPLWKILRYVPQRCYFLRGEIQNCCRFMLGCQKV